MRTNGKTACGRMTINAKGVFFTVLCHDIWQTLAQRDVRDNKLSAFQLFTKENREATQSRGCD